MTVYDTSLSKTVGGLSYMQAISPATNYNVNFNGGLKISSTPLSAAGIDFSDFECIAQNAKAL
jgi:hypothetical protein